MRSSFRGVMGLKVVVFYDKMASDKIARPIPWVGGLTQRRRTSMVFDVTSQKPQ